MLTESQIKAHYEGIGGSMASSILGLNPYQSNVDAYLLLTDEDFRREQQKELENNLRIKIGNALEDIVASHVMEEKGWVLEKCDETLRDPEFPFLIAHPDRLIKIDGVLKEGMEIKTRGTFAAREYGEEDSDVLPDSEYIQDMHYMMVTGFQRWHSTPLILGDGVVKYYTVPRNNEMIAHMRAECVRFWNEHVLPRKAPDPLTYEQASRLWPKSIKKTIIANSMIVTSTRRLLKVKDAISRLTVIEDKLKCRIATYMKDNDTLIDPNNNKEIVTYKTQSNNRIDVDLLRVKYPAAATECTPTGKTSRVMRVSKKGGKQ